jgi:hypothetical protein
MRLRITTIIALALALASCSNSSSNNSPVTIPTTVRPGPGSWWLNVSQYHDSTGALTETDTVLATLLDTGLSIYGKTRVLRLRYEDHFNYITSSQQFIDTGYVRFEDNGDLSRYQLNGPLTGQWFRLPFGSQNTIHILFRSAVESGVDSVDAAFGGAGTGSFTIKGRTYVTTKLSYTERTKDSTKTSLAWSDWAQSALLETAHFSPEIGVIVLEDEPSYRDQGGALSKSWHSELVDFQLK